MSKKPTEKLKEIYKFTDLTNLLENEKKHQYR